MTVRIKKLLLVLTLAFTLVISGLSLGVIKGANADTDLSGINKENFYVAGASVRVKNDEFGQGVRFHVHMSKSAFNSISTNGVINEDVKTYVAVLPDVLLKDGESVETATSDEVMHIETTEYWREYDENTMESIAYVYGIPADYYGVNLSAASYIKTSGSTSYSKDKAQVSMSWVAQQEINNPDTTLSVEQLEGLRQTYLNEYTVTYVNDGAIETLEKVSGSLLEEVVPEKEGYVFDGWYINDTDVKWDFNKNTVSKNVTLNAKWVDSAITASVPNFAFVGDEIALSATVAEGVSVKAYVNGIENVEESFVPSEVGAYTIKYEAVINGKVINSVENVINVYAKEEGNITYFNQPIGLTSIGSFNGCGANVTNAFVKEGEDYVLDFYSWTPSWPTIKITNPYVKNLNAVDGKGDYLYNYVYFYVYTDKSATSLQIGTAATSYLTANQWNLILLGRDDTTFNCFGKNVFDSNSDITADDITNLTIMANTYDETTESHVYFTTFRAVNKLPDSLLAVEENVVAPFNQIAGIAHVRNDGLTPYAQLSITNEKVANGEDYSLKYVSGSNYFGAVAINLTNVAIKNISSYKYLYFSYYTETEGVTCTPGAQWTGSADNSVGIWKNIIMVNDGNGNFTTYGIGTAGIVGGNVEGLQIYFYAPTAGATIYISSIRVANIIIEKDAVVNLSTLDSASYLGNPNAVAFGPSSVYKYGGETNSNEFYLQAPGYQPTIYITAPSITNLNAVDENGDYIYNYVYFYVYSTGNATKLGIHYAAGQTVLANGQWTRIVLTRVGDTFYHEGQNIWQTTDVTANNITGTQMCFNTIGESNYTSVFMTSWRACKTLPEA